MTFKDQSFSEDELKSFLTEDELQELEKLKPAEIPPAEVPPVEPPPAEEPETPPEEPSNDTPAEDPIDEQKPDDKGFFDADLLASVESLAPQEDTAPQALDDIKQRKDDFEMAALEAKKVELEYKTYQQQLPAWVDQNGKSYFEYSPSEFTAYETAYREHYKDDPAQLQAFNQFKGLYKQTQEFNAYVQQQRENADAQEWGYLERAYPQLVKEKYGYTLDARDILKIETARKELILSKAITASTPKVKQIEMAVKQSGLDKAFTKAAAKAGAKPQAAPDAITTKSTAKPAGGGNTRLQELLSTNPEKLSSKDIDELWDLGWESK